MNTCEKAEKDFREMLEVAGLKVKPSYPPGEVQAVLGVSDRTFHRMIDGYEVDPQSGQPRKPGTLDSFTLSRSRRVRHGELVDYLRRNNTYERVCAS